jgi:hypothetical protein
MTWHEQPPLVRAGPVDHRHAVEAAAGQGGPDRPREHRAVDVRPDRALVMQDRLHRQAAQAGSCLAGAPGLGSERLPRGLGRSLADLKKIDTTSSESTGQPLVRGPARTSLPVVNLS